MDKLFKKINQLKKDDFTGTITLSFHKGSLSKMIKVQTTEDTESDADSENTYGLNIKDIK